MVEIMALKVLCTVPGARPFNELMRDWAVVSNFQRDLFRDRSKSRYLPVKKSLERTRAPPSNVSYHRCQLHSPSTFSMRLHRRIPGAVFRNPCEECSCDRTEPFQIGRSEFSQTRTPTAGRPLAVPPREEQRAGGVSGHPTFPGCRATSY